MTEGVKIENITKTFPGVKALSNVSFSIKEGEVHALLGENGAGKSTLLNILHGIYQADEGKIFLKGKEVHFQSPNEAIMGGISKVHQEINSVKDLTVGQNITLGYEITKKGFWVDYKETNKLVNEVLDRLNCSFRSEDLVSTLTAGEMQMVAIAKAIYHKSTVISFDEPTSSLTEKETQALFSTIKQLKQEGITIIYVSHRLEEIFQICDRATILKDGCYVTTVDVKDTTKAQLITYMAGREIKTDVNHQFKDCSNAETVLSVKNFSSNKFKNVTFELKKGEILGFFGLVGSGRTELMRAVFGADKKTSGELELKGKIVNIRNTQDALKNQIGLLPEERKTQGFVNLMSNLDNASFSILDKYSRHGFIEKKKLEDNYADQAEKLKIQNKDPKFLTANLSGGNQQKVILARWLSTDAEILIFDEPTKGIDVATKYEIYKLMEGISASGKSIIMISSELPEIMSISDRVAVMYEGELQTILKNDGSLTEDGILSYAMGGLK